MSKISPKMINEVYWKKSNHSSKLRGRKVRMLITFWSKK